MRRVSLRVALLRFVSVALVAFLVGLLSQSYRARRGQQRSVPCVLDGVPHQPGPIRMADGKIIVCYDGNLVPLNQFIRPLEEPAGR